ncbi:MAG: aspartate--tRNA(Asn) ligase [Thermoproteota archaeon]|jgi:nondiscriminating aspartyl-tRNA synthetase|uniref:Aspartate--tRNA(Asp) ligase n=1 Tax=Candidatus Nitrosopelagicus brevis TaxID=1410606 RepID=A0A0A7V716_9ARCH|nr:aspartate--tRNA(Asn) ligase [Candidatus Nitrosopelagicus brevis]MCH2618346.1 aspartate--tRNA(Asn) ligase [Candidatus Nitrosopelagicus sp.]MEC7707499.1 aspartate--tRNA(Asn) ligase [Thermoproteota archaeon]AJA92470.1 aspartate--tRNA(Asn) ligase [Candidatus Nitrosopelagicus brevis]MEC9087213.1 aspartate--tRNA(Asn) ligase [Thermoproteota archaeon]PTL88119.1 aspartate--tRNA(Asn) ligase [Candidatus Nitrosopelagicus brevis]|tara:strand:+ start:93 stop:1379 length:1287 start_codon:yes stop_codon:yes gene_type:complete
MDISRTHLIEDLNSSMEGQDVLFGGWVVDLRKLGKMAFLTVRDVTGMCQVIVKGDAMSLLEGLNRQSVVRILGKVQASKAKDFDFEVSAIELQVLAKAEYPLPIDPIGRLESDIDNRLNSRALDMRNQKTASIFKLRSQVLASIRETLIKRKFIEINTPKIIGSASEGGADLFSLDYFGKQAYLAQSPQLYKEQMTIGLERVFEISSFYRAEKSHTGRHLSEFTSVDIEAAMMDYTDVMDVLESIVVDVFKNTAENSKTEQQDIGHEIKIPDSPFERVSYTQALEELGNLDIKLEFGEDLQDSHLRSLGDKHPGFFFLTDWPMKLKPFYIHEKDDDPTLSRSFDLQYGYLELSSGGRRLHDPEQLKSRLKEQNLDPASFEEHLKTFGWGMPPHSGWGMGLDRLMTVLIGIDNVREVTLYPRDPDRLKP